jgi:signal transduction histidine kinase
MAAPDAPDAPSAHGAPDAADGGSSRPPLLHLRSSVLGKVLGALVVVLVVSTAVTALVDARLTHSAVATQTEQVATSNLRVLQEAFSERQRTLQVSLQTLADRLVGDNLTDPARRSDLIAQLGSAASSLQLDQLDVVDDTGAALNPPVSVGRLTPFLPFGGGASFTTEPTSHLVTTLQGPFVQALPVPIGADRHPLVLIGGREFGDDLAYDLRRQLGGLANVLLVVGSHVAGSTLATPTATPPAFDKGSGLPPARPKVDRLAGVQSVVAYVAVGRSGQDPIGGALGIALPDPAAGLDRALGSRRVIAGTVLAVLAVILGLVLFRALTQPLVNLAATAVRIAGGELDRPFVAQGSDEIARLAGALEHMRSELQAKLALVGQQAAELRESSQRIVAAQDHERRRLARDLHDGIQQQLVIMRMRLGLGQEAFASAPTPAASAADSGGANGEASLLADLAEQLDRTIEGLREVSHDLYPAILRDRGLGAAARSYAGRLPLESRLAMSPDPLPRLAPDVESAAYFLMCEAVTNALKHSHADELTVTLAVEDGHLRVGVADDGRGFDAAAGTRHGGLLHMEDRVRSFGGDLRIESRPGAGTSVVARFPLDPPNGAAAT